MGALPGEHAQRHAHGFVRDLEGVESSPAFFGSCFSNFGAPAPFLDLGFQLADALEQPTGALRCLRGLNGRCQGTCLGGVVWKPSPWMRPTAMSAVMGTRRPAEVMVAPASSSSTRRQRRVLWNPWHRVHGQLFVLTGHRRERKRRPQLGARPGGSEALANCQGLTTG